MGMKNQLKKSLPNNSDYICCFSRCRGLSTKSLIAWLNKTILKMFYFRSPLILRGGMEGIKLLFMALVLKMSLIIPAQATTCAVPPTCQQMGYTMKKADCGENPVLRCPFALSDDNQVFCGAVAENTSQVVSIGAIVYGDGTVASGVVTGKTPIGVVFDTANRLAVALTDVKKDGTAGSETMLWSSASCDTPGLQNCTTTEISYGTDLTPITCGVDGRLNTNAILASTCNGTTYAATATNNYQPAGCTKDFCKKSKWFLPSIRDLQNIYLQKTQIDASLTLLKSNGATDIGTKYYWSSTENLNNLAWLFLMGNGYRGNGYKSNYNYYVRPVLAF